jgi:molybdenum cofactor cytidylyltransferase
LDYVVNLYKALRLGPGQTAAFVGAGGKSAAIARLVNEIEGEVPVVVTTTTHLGVEQSNWTQSHLVRYSSDTRPQLLKAIQNAQSVLVTGPLNAAGDRWTGLGQPALEKLWRDTIEQGAVFLIEADGARRRWIKAPDDHEPVLPVFADLVVPVVGMQAWGRKLNNEIAHRPELLASRLGIKLGERLEDEHFLAWATSEDLALKNVPPGSRVRILINQVASETLREAARRIASSLRADPRVEATVMANIGREPEWMECVGRIAGVVLAAGGSSRTQRQKLLYAWRGKPLVRHVVEIGLGAGLEPVVVVLGESAESIRSALADLPVTFVMNPDWQDGQSSSVRTGLTSIGLAVEAAVFLLGDMPLVTDALIKGLISAHQSSLAPIVAPWADERWGNPVLFDRVTFDDLEQVEGDRGGRHLFDRFSILPVPAGPEALFDCDTNEDLKWLTAHYP